MDIKDLNALHLKDFNKLIMEKKKKFLVNCIHFYEKKNDLIKVSGYQKQLTKLEKLLSNY